ncbi:MAG: hypothetical protein ACF8Q5_02235 [Phycisphaerales bacterium JB040]
MPTDRFTFRTAAASVVMLGALAGLPASARTLATPAAQPAGEDLPSGWEVLETYVKARGGAERYLELEAIRAVGKFSMEMPMAMEGEVVRTEAAPNMIHMSIELGGMGTMVQATDGEVAWAIQPGSTEPVILQGEMAQQMLRRANFHDIVRPRERYESATVVGIEDVEGKPSYRVDLVDKHGESSVGFYSVETGLQTKAMSRTSPNAEQFDQTSWFFDWKEIDGVMHPMTIRQQNQGNEFYIRFDSVEHDPELDRSIFSPPVPETPAGEI